MNTTFERIAAGKDEWLTPPDLIKSLGDFDLDPCSPVNRPWDTAKKHYNINDMGLLQKWDGRVWLNPPYGNETGHWLSKLRLHGNGIALVFARTDTTYFQEYVFGVADAILFIKGRLKFFHATGIPSKDTAGAPSVLIAYGTENAIALKRSAVKGTYVDLKSKLRITGISEPQNLTADYEPGH